MAKKRKLTYLLGATAILFMVTVLGASRLNAQIAVGNGKISGEFGFSGMYYIPDSLIGARAVESKFRANTFLSLQYSNGGFTVGARYEFYLYPLIDFEDIGYKGHGLTNYFADYRNSFIQVTAGTFYEQFGNGLTLRMYEDRQLGVDNSLTGARVRITPYKGIYIKGLVGLERNNFDFKLDDRKDYVRGIDAEFSFSDMFPVISEKGFTAIIGGNFVSKYEKAVDKFITIYPHIDTLKQDAQIDLPQNVATWAARAALGYKGFRLEGEFAQKENDPNESNQYIYKKGNALFLSATYSMKGLGVSASFIRADNMDFRSQRAAQTITSLFAINYIPAINRQYSYQLIGNYGYASQPNGQIGAQLQVNYQIPRKTKVGGQYGTDITFNFSRFHDIDKTPVPMTDSLGTASGTDGYKSKFFKFGKNLLYQDIGLELSRRFDKHWKLILAYNFISYNLELLQEHGKMFFGHNVAADLTCKINSKHALRLELQHLYAKEDTKSWVYAMLEYSISPHWFISVGDQYNYGNADKDMRIHYFNVTGAFVTGTTRIGLSFGKTREGILCVGGVCRSVPASYGLGLTVNTTF
ncbi:MAG: DUF6029 family protein [Bacteroidales bacterium]|jgi:hypothetical protein|nr:DUF6029 family protein [Bacteroidales bacterium]